MSKPGPKECALRAFRDARGRWARGPTQSVSAVKSGGSRLSPRDEANLSLNAGFIASNPDAFPTPLRSPDGFDRRSYQRVYCRLRRKYGPISSWPADALGELRSLTKAPKPL